MKGYVALTTILVILPLLLLAGVDSVYKNLTSLLVGKMSYDFQVLQTSEETCLEESVYRIKRSANYVGDFSISQQDWECNVNVANKEGSAGIKIISIVVSDINDIKISSTKELNTNENPYILKNL